MAENQMKTPRRGGRRGLIIIIFILLCVVLALGFITYLQLSSTDGRTDDMATTTDTTTGMEDEETNDESATSTTDITEREGEFTIGTSVEGRDITAYRYGNGDTELLFVGGIHGGYSWNTALVSYELVDYFEDNPEAIPDSVAVTVVPVLNPDGLNKVVGTASRFSASDVPSDQDDTVPGRFNANNVDLNRNFDCDWQADATWQNQSVDGGDEAFSEPESQAIRDLVDELDPDGVVAFYSAAGGVFASSCHNGVLAETEEITNVYADASGYQAYENYDFYQITGDMVNWLAKEEIPAISVLLTSHENTEWNKNQAGIDALLEYYAE